MRGRYWGGPVRTYHHTGPVNAMYGLHEGLRIVEEHGLELMWSAHRCVWAVAGR